MSYCLKCGEYVYTTSRLLEDAFTLTDQGYTHLKCPSTTIKHKTFADGYCGVCGNSVPKESLNRFYCGSSHCNSVVDSYFSSVQEDDVL